MTRIAGTNIIKAPCCDALYSTTAFASINFMASEHWTDGATENSLSQSDGGLRRCTCGGYFLSGYAERVGFIPKNNGQQQEQTKHSIDLPPACRTKVMEQSPLIDPDPVSLPLRS